MPAPWRVVLLLIILSKIFWALRPWRNCSNECYCSRPSPPQPGEQRADAGWATVPGRWHCAVLTLGQWLQRIPTLVHWCRDHGQCRGAHTGQWSPHTVHWSPLHTLAWADHWSSFLTLSNTLALFRLPNVNTGQLNMAIMGTREWSLQKIVLK